MKQCLGAQGQARKVGSSLKPSVLLSKKTPNQEVFTILMIGAFLCPFSCKMGTFLMELRFFGAKKLSFIFNNGGKTLVHSL